MNNLVTPDVDVLEGQLNRVVEEIERVRSEEEDI